MSWIQLLILYVHASPQEKGVEEEERLGFFPDVKTVYCECGINVELLGDKREMTFGHKPACPYPAFEHRGKKFEPFTVQKNDNGTYTCGVQGGHCVDITYYVPEKPARLYENNSTYCHKRSCATMVKRFRGCVASDKFIQDVYRQSKANKTKGLSARLRLADTDPHFPKPESICHGTYGSPPEYNGSYFVFNKWAEWGISHVPVEGGCQPLCAPLNSTNEKEICREKDNNCMWSRIYCCDEHNCNTDNGLKRKYKGASYNEWMTRLEESMREIRAATFSAGNMPTINASLVMAVCLWLCGFRK